MTPPDPEPETEPRWLGEADHETWIPFVRMLIRLPTALDNQLQRDSGLSHFEYGILAALTHADNNTRRMSELAIYANGSLSRLSRAVARLERRNWITRAPDPTDGRYTLATLTPEGETVVHAAAPGHAETVNRLVFDPLTTTQARQLRTIATRILNAVDDADCTTPPRT